MQERFGVNTATRFELLLLPSINDKYLIAEIVGWLGAPHTGEEFIERVDRALPATNPNETLGPTLEEASMSLVDRAAEWPEQWRREGRSEGKGEGMAKALHAIAEQRFGAETGARLAALLPSIDAAARVTEVHQWIASSRTGDELIRRVSGTQA